jgi:tRNA threonylcarbamoyladenosine biosynthesis protein TsaB
VTRPLVDATVLALDSAGRACGVCLWRDGRVLARADRAMDHGHAEALAPMTGKVLAEAAVAVGDLDAIAVTVGPGGFTGLRVGLAMARGLALAARCPVLGATTTAVLARMAQSKTDPDERPITVVLDARRAEVYAQSFDRTGRALDSPASWPPDALTAALGPGPRLLIGDGVALLPHPLPPEVEVSADADSPPDPAVLAALVAEDPDAALPATPVYVRPPDATRPQPHARARS